MQIKPRIKEICGSTVNRENLLSRRIKSQRVNFILLSTLKNVETNRSSWKTFRPLFYNSESREKITLIEDGKIIIDDKSIGQCFNNYFANSTDTLNIPRPVDIMLNEQSGDPIIDAVEIYKTHPSIVMIKEKTRGHTFEFSHIDQENEWPSASG